MREDVVSNVSDASTPQPHSQQQSHLPLCVLRTRGASLVIQTIICRSIATSIPVPGTNVCHIFVLPHDERLRLRVWCLLAVSRYEPQFLLPHFLIMSLSSRSLSPLQLLPLATWCQIWQDWGKKAHTLTHRHAHRCKTSP